jgi:hypothetical protein
MWDAVYRAKTLCKHVTYGCGMQSKGVWSLNHDITLQRLGKSTCLKYDITTSFRLSHTPIILKSTLDLLRHNSVRVDPYAHPEHVKVLKHSVYK